MRAYYGDPTIKEKYLARVAAHRAAGELLQGYGYWRDGKGCAVGCTIHSSDVVVYEDELYIPQILASFKDVIFEGLAYNLAQEWPERFLSAIKLGQDLSGVGWRLLHWLLTNKTITPGINHPIVAEAVAQCALVLEPLTQGEPPDMNMATWALLSANNAVWTVENMGETEPISAVRAARVARSAARAVLRTADVWVWDIPDTAVWTPKSAELATTRAAWRRIANKLISLIKAA